MKYLKYCVMALLFSAIAAADRVGFEENFENADGWTLKYGAPLRSVKSNEDGTVTFSTVRGTLSMGKRDWPEWEPRESTTGVEKKYDWIVDLDKYHYVVVKTTERGTMSKMAVCGSWIPVLYTDGLRVFDLRDRKIAGEKALRITLEFLNSSAPVSFDYIRLVSELTEDEKKGLIAPPLDYFEENLSVPPYHNLEAQNARAGRYRLQEAEGQLLVFEDAATRGETWKLTDQPGNQTFRSGDTTRGWSQDGRYFSIAGGKDGRNVWDYETATWRETLGAGALSSNPVPSYAATWNSELHPAVMYGYRMIFNRPKVDFVFYRYDMIKGVEKEFGRFRYDYVAEGSWAVREISQGGDDKIVVGLRETPHVWIINPEGKTPEEIVRHIKLTTRLKGVRFVKDDKFLSWHNCYTFEGWEMELATGNVAPGYYIGWSHAGKGFGRTIRGYDGGVRLVHPSGLSDWRAGDAIKIFSHYSQPFSSDYGSLIDGGRWWLSNGNGGDVKRQHILVDGEDSATILRLAGYNTSRNAFSVNTYTIASPDATKVAWLSDQFGAGEVYYVVARKPDPVRNLKIEKPGSAVKMWWTPPERSLETAGYVVYGAGKDEKFKPLEIVSENEWIGETEATRFMVAAREWSGIEGFLSPMVRLPEDEAPGTVHLDVWIGDRSRTARTVFDGHANGTRCVRNFRASDSERDIDATVLFNIDSRAGNEKYFMRWRPDTPLGEWEWKDAGKNVKTIGKGLLLSIPEGVLVDKLIVSTFPAYKPETVDDRFRSPSPVRSPRAESNNDGEITISWKKPDDLSFARVEIFAGPDEHIACDNVSALGTVLARQEQKFIDWARQPGTTITYKIVSVDTRGNRSAPSILEAAVPALELQYVEIDFSKTGFDQKFQVVNRGGEDMIAPKPEKASGRPDPANFVALDFPFEVAADGKYSVWVRYSPGYTPRLNLPTILNGEEGEWSVRPPYRPMSSARDAPEDEKRQVFSDKLSIGGKERFGLRKGSHKLYFFLDPAAGEVHAIAKIWVSNDPSFRPEGYNPRADFGK